MEIVFFRCLVSGLICGVEISRRQLDWKGNNHVLLIARGTFGTLALFTFFLTLQRLPLATAVTIQYLSPIFTALIGVFVCEKWCRHANGFSTRSLSRGVRAPGLRFADLHPLSAHRDHLRHLLGHSLQPRASPLRARRPDCRRAPFPARGYRRRAGLHLLQLENAVADRVVLPPHVRRPYPSRPVMPDQVVAVRANTAAGRPGGKVVSPSSPSDESVLWRTRQSAPARRPRRSGLAAGPLPAAVPCGGEVAPGLSQRRSGHRSRAQESDRRRGPPARGRLMATAYRPTYTEVLGLI
ncbi:MAG: DMT family transporter [Chthoniobacterales bacterium]|nr:DMT family transporter [Chthoniobacterales bacterium]